MHLAQYRHARIELVVANLLYYLIHSEIYVGRSRLAVQLVTCRLFSL